MFDPSLRRELAPCMSTAMGDRNLATALQAFEDAARPLAPAFSRTQIPV
jgi:hypothetical protein